jgi:uncharacterized membrane-anchored protein YitT (DUF2179 family)
MQKKFFAKEAVSYLLLFAGMLLYTFSWVYFLIPKEIAGGGLTGLASVIFYATGLPVPYTYFGINVLLLVVGTIIMGKGFGFKTIFCIICGTLMLEFLPMLGFVSTIEDSLINAVLGGTLSGVGISIVFLSGGSSGGTDIIAIIISKYRETSPGRVFLVCDLIIIGSVIFLPGKTLENVIYGYIQMVSFSYILDSILTGNKQSVQILIFSSKYAEIADMINTNFERGVTALNSIGWYSQQEGKLLIVVARKSQLQAIARAIKEKDENAFITVSPATSVYGRGFEQIKSGFKKKDNENKKQKDLIGA